jgi:peptidoglycan hydrolase-like protein with peptidoglycan-binding domain
MPHSMSVIVIASLLASSTLALAQAQRPAAPANPPAAPALDPAQAASKAAFDRLDDAERKAIQNDLIWSGDFNGVAGGEFGRRTYDAMLGFERRTGGVADGILTPPERASLKRAADEARLALRFAEINDAATGIRIGLPAALLTQRIAVDNGVVWRRADGAVSLQLVKLPAAQAFADLFEQMRQDGPGRKVTYRLQRPDWFVVSGEEGGRKFYTRLAQGPGGVRGYTFRYPADQAVTLDRIMIAIANTFEPFPGTDVAVNPSRASAAGPAAPTPALIQPGPRIAEARHAISGVSLGGGRVMTSRTALASCASPTVNGQPVDTAAAAATGDAVTFTVAGLNQPALQLAAAASPARVFTLSLEDAAQRAVMVSAGRWEATGSAVRVTSALQIGPGGAPVVDGQGRLVGLVREGPRNQRIVGGIVPEASYAVVPLAPAGAAQAPEPSPRLVNAAAASLVEIRCARRQ